MGHCKFYIGCHVSCRDGTGSLGQWLPWLGRVMGQCVRPGVWPSLEFLTCAFIVALFLQTNTVSANWWIYISRPSCITSNGHDFS